MGKADFIAAECDQKIAGWTIQKILCVYLKVRIYDIRFVYASKNNNILAFCLQKFKMFTHSEMFKICPMCI